MNFGLKPLEQFVCIPGTPKITVLLKRNKRSRRMSLRVSRIRGKVSLSMPMSCPVEQAKSFLIEKELWIRKNLTLLPETTQIIFGNNVLYRGKKTLICTGEGQKVKQIASKLIVPGPERAVASQVKAFLKFQAREALYSATDHYSKILGQSYKKITLRDTISRWGSCSVTGNINYSWRLIMAPIEVLNYVAAHEVAHLVEMNHSKKFWSVVEDLFPDYSQQRSWLKHYGEDLHCYKF